jgi:prepilin signal peptidase PulO-like enzyme (type II secretory pathway)
MSVGADLISLVMILAAGVMLACLIRVGEVTSILGVAREADRKLLAREIQVQRLLMGFFALGYVAVAVAIRWEIRMMDDQVTAAVFLGVAVFAYIGITIQVRMGAAMLKTISGLIPICAWCKRIRTGDSPVAGSDSWSSVETFLSRRTEADFTHGICPDCAARMKAGVTAK